MFEIVETEEFADWLSRLLDSSAKAIIAQRLLRLSRGNPGDSKFVGRDVSELRIHHGPGYRIYYTQRGERLILLLCGGDKDSQQRDIARAHAMAEQDI
ncbi:type II toxin-antitoxin system RelE/ParE family toxin [Brevundimonas sp.]|uniref:type II toxin-antitoxin system RelE/ParE family toxin n=1 Tax=Brevundimonas sp. TaxID=1871086 RepID=UPI002AB8C10B|nr:type II toxin-antitoxin system RelE/ParE family toxin [Brevundimonas sp.]MDZ4362642.1 type II toxin-antitoxin system RelE/ParE family toxin [Brevundimonas sp.]